MVQGTRRVRESPFWEFVRCSWKKLQPHWYVTEDFLLATKLTCMCDKAVPYCCFRWKGKEENGIRTSSVKSPGTNIGVGMNKWWLDCSPVGWLLMAESDPCSHESVLSSKTFLRWAHATWRKIHFTTILDLARVNVSHSAVSKEALFISMIAEKWGHMGWKIALIACTKKWHLQTSTTNRYLSHCLLALWSLCSYQDCSQQPFLCIRQEGRVRNALGAVWGWRF